MFTKFTESRGWWKHDNRKTIEWTYEGGRNRVTYLVMTNGDSPLSRGYILNRCVVRDDAFNLTVKKR